MSHLTIAVPHEAHKADYVTNMVCENFAYEFGGFTTYPECVGGWIGPDGDTIEEPVTIIESYTDMSEGELVGLVRSMAIDVLAITHEDAVMYTVNHDAYFVSED